MTSIRKLGAAALVLVLAAGSASADTYVRKGNQDISITFKNGLLYCTRVSDHFEMCHGMAKQPDGTYKGHKMKHPDMPGFMTFNGTVTFHKDSLTIRGCTLGICQSETWPKKG